MMPRRPYGGPGEIGFAAESFFAPGFKQPNSLTERLLKRLERRARRVCKQHECIYALPDGYLIQLFIDQNGLCAKTKKPFSLAPVIVGTKVLYPHKPSLDRIVSDDDLYRYRIGNVRLVKVSVNYALNQYGDAHLEEMSRDIANAKVP